MSMLRWMCRAFPNRYLMHDGRLRRGGAANFLDTADDAGQNVRYRSRGVSANLARCFDTAINRSLCSTTDVFTRFNRSLQDAIDGTSCDGADIRAHRGRMFDNRLNRFGCGCGNIAANLVHAQHDTFRNALGAHDQPGAHLLGRLQGATHNVTYHDHQFIGDRPSGSEGA